jgi:antitoxin PrlF
MPHSTVTKKGQTTIPDEVRKALHIKPGDTIEYDIEDGRVTIRVHAGVKSLKGALASDKGCGLSFAKIRQIAATKANRRHAQ